MKTITIGTGSGAPNFELSNAQEKALYWDIYELRDWIENTLQVKISELANRLIIANTTKDPNQMTYSAKLTEVDGMSGFAPGSAISITVSGSGIPTIDLSTTETGILELNDEGIKTLIEDLTIIKAKDAIDWIVKDNSTQQLDSLTDAQKETIVNDAIIQSAKERMES